MRVEGDRLPRAAFQNEPVNEHMDLAEDFTIWKRTLDVPSYVPNPNHVSFVQHPFLLTLSKKSEILTLENRVLQTRERRAAMMESILRGDPGIQSVFAQRQPTPARAAFVPPCTARSGGASPHRVITLRHCIAAHSFPRRVPGRFLRLRVSRGHVVRDAITQLSSIQTSDPMRLRKRLRIEFLGEEGLDEGGVQKEFFQLILRDLFDPK